MEIRLMVVLFCCLNYGITNDDIGIDIGEGILDEIYKNGFL